ncbi:hypothetical protein BofuT4_P143670.1 [Botrytis cinerea T4]|uniref:Uncharacterized protein n=1 Tax=Botryotinia fuckeliana (strain T4) TaxID=999810 RepID=G2YY61_BOTF4|nr:hypothetical protein BofuT4_P143670.1 [Botrytis cinerea T4]
MADYGVTTEAEKLAGMLDIHAEMTRKWKASKFHAVQKEWLEKTIFPLKLAVDSALLMGVGGIGGNPNGSYMYGHAYGEGEGLGVDICNLSQVVAFECWIDILSCFSAAMPDLAVMSPLWVDSWQTSPAFKGGRDYNRMRRTIRQYARTHLSQKQGPLFEHNTEENLKDLSIDRLMHNWLQNSEWYWTPDDLSVIGDIGEPIDQEVWRFLPGIYGIVDTLGGGAEYMEIRLEFCRRHRLENPLEEIPSGSEYEYEGKEDEPEPEPQPIPGPKTDKSFPSSKRIPRSPSYRDSYHGNKRRLIGVRKLRAYRDDGRVNFS